MLIRVRRERRDALTLPIRWQVSIKVTPITAASGLPLTLGCPGRQLRVGGLTSAPGRPWLPVGSAGRGMAACPPAPPGLRSLLPLCLLGTSGSSPFPIVLGAKVPLRIFFTAGALHRAERRRGCPRWAAGGTAGESVSVSEHHLGYCSVTVSSSSQPGELSFPFLAHWEGDRSGRVPGQRILGCCGGHPGVMLPLGDASASSLPTAYLSRQPSAMPPDPIN